jgi:hypothetical protein
MSHRQTEHLERAKPIAGILVTDRVFMASLLLGGEELKITIHLIGAMRFARLLPALDRRDMRRDLLSTTFLGSHRTGCTAQDLYTSSTRWRMSISWLQMDRCLPGGWALL